MQRGARWFMCARTVYWHIHHWQVEGRGRGRGGWEEKRGEEATCSLWGAITWNMRHMWSVQSGQVRWRGRCRRRGRRRRRGGLMQMVLMESVKAKEGGGGEVLRAWMMRVERAEQRGRPGGRQSITQLPPSFTECCLCLKNKKEKQTKNQTCEHGVAVVCAVASQSEGCEIDAPTWALSVLHVLPIGDSQLAIESSVNNFVFYVAWQLAKFYLRTDTVQHISRSLFFTLYFTGAASHDQLLIILYRSPKKQHHFYTFLPKCLVSVSVTRRSQHAEPTPGWWCGPKLRAGICVALVPFVTSEMKY